MVRRKKIKSSTSDRVKSPCINVCEYIEGTNICNGCGRTSDEIVDWYVADAKRKKQIVEDAAIRLNQKLQNKSKEL